jgi:hypothetical protein
MSESLPDDESRRDARRVVKENGQRQEQGWLLRLDRFELEQGEEPKGSELESSLVSVEEANGFNSRHQP